jgi:hypothetical protein
MSFTLSREFINEGITRVDNVFLSAYLPDAEPLQVKIYLFGLFLAGNGGEDNSIKKMALELKIAEESVIDAFRYWESKDLVALSKTEPFKITYRPVKAPLKPIIKINAAKYSFFVEELFRLFPEKVFPEYEIVSLVEFMEFHKMEINAMLMVIRYCMNINRLSTNYFLAVAAEWAKQGLNTEEKVNAHIEELERNGGEILLVKQALGKKTDADYDDRKLYLKWTREFNYGLDILLIAAKSFKKRGNMQNLDALLTELKQLNAATQQDVAEHLKTKEDIRQLTQDVVKNLGLFYNDLDMAVKFYINPWKTLGFTDGALKLISEYCFVQNVRSLSGMGNLVDKFYSLGTINETSIQSYIDKQVEADEHIKEVLSAAGGARYVSNRDRTLYKTFIEEWGFSHDAVLAVAKNSVNNPYPMTAISKKLAAAKEKGVKDLAAVNSFLGEEKTKFSAPFSKPLNREASLEKQAFSTINSRRAKAEEEAERLIKELRKDAYFAELETELNRLKFEALGSPKTKLDALNAQILQKQEAFEAWLLGRNLTAQRLLPQYTCTACNDTGMTGVKNCACVQSEIEILKKERLNAVFELTVDS